jgi:hypothetical protein
MPVVRLESLTYVEDTGSGRQETVLLPPENLIKEWVNHSGD